MTDNNIKARVEAGMAWLDEHHPGWERRIDLATLDLFSGCQCVLGQALRDMAVSGIDGWSGYTVGSRRMYADGLDPSWLGFDILSGHWEEWEPLEAEWREQIKRRFDTGVLSDDVVRPA